MADLETNIGAFAKAWSTRIGSEPVKPAAAFEVPTNSNTCSSLYGEGKCKDTMPEAEVARYDIRYKRLNRWTAISKPKACGMSETWSGRQLSFIGTQVDVVPADGPTGILALMIFPMLHKQMFYVESAVPPPLGTTVQFRPPLRTCNCVTRLALVQEWEAAWVAYRVRYKQVGLVAYEVLGLDLMTDVEREHAAAMNRNKEGSRMAALLRNLDVKTCKRKKTTHATALPSDDEGLLDEMDMDIDQDKDLLDDDDKASSDGHGAADSDIDIDAHIGPEDEGDGDGSERESEGDSSIRDVDLPEYSAENGYVREHAAPHAILGRISVIREGTPRAAISLYCRRHGCSILRTVDKAPSRDSCLRWFQAGLDVPTGRTAALRKRHADLLLD